MVHGSIKCGWRYIVQNCLIVSTHISKINPGKDFNRAMFRLINELGMSGQIIYQLLIVPLQKILFLNKKNTYSGTFIGPFLSLITSIIYMYLIYCYDITYIDQLYSVWERHDYLAGDRVSQKTKYYKIK